MLYEVITKKNPQNLEMIPKFKAAIEKMEVLITEIEALQVKQEQDKTGVTADTNLVIMQLKDYMLDISGALQTHATENNNNTLLERISFSENTIYHLSKKDRITSYNVCYTKLLRKKLFTYFCDHILP